jgi:hypothetical protein
MKRRSGFSSADHFGQGFQSQRLLLANEGGQVGGGSCHAIKQPFIMFLEEAPEFTVRAGLPGCIERLSHLRESHRARLDFAITNSLFELADGILGPVRDLPHRSLLTSIGLPKGRGGVQRLGRLRESRDQRKNLFFGGARGGEIKAGGGTQERD